MPEEIFIIIIVGISAGTLSGIVAQFFSYLKSRAPRTGSGTSMTTSELEGMIQKWITEATRPLADRIDTVEGQLGQLESGTAKEENSILDDMDGYEAIEKEPALRRRARS